MRDLRFVLRILTLLLLAAGAQANAFLLLNKVGKVADDIGDNGKITTHAVKALDEISGDFRRIPHVSNRPRAILQLEPDGLSLGRETGAREIIVPAAVLHDFNHLSNDLARMLRSLDVFILDKHFFDLRHTLTELPNATSLFVLDNNNSITAIRQVMSEGKKALTLETKPGILIDVGDLSQLRDLQWAFSQPLYRHDMRVVSLFDPSDVDVIREIGRSVGELHTPLDRLGDGGLARTISHKKRKVYLLVGHVEGDAFVVRNASGTVTARYTFSELDNAARVSDSTVVPFVST